MKLKKKLFTLGGIMLAPLLLLSACGSKTTDKQVLNWDESSELPTMDLSKATDTISFDMLNNSMEGLYRLGKNSKVEPGIAKATKISKNGLVYTFTLRDTDKWSDGKKVTPKDFVYSWRRTVDPKTASQYSYLFDGIKNANEIVNGKKPASSLGIKATGKNKLTVTLTKKIPYFNLLMGFPSFFPQQKATVDKYGSKYGTSSKYMTYNGPFKMGGWTGSNLKWKMTKNSNYWDKKKVKLNQINFQVNKSTTTSYNLYQSHKLDQTGLSAEQAKNLAGKTGYRVLPQALTAYLEFNQTKKEFQNKKIRQALSYAIDREKLVKKIVGNGAEVSKGVVSSNLAEYKGKDFADQAATTAGVTYNKAKAKKLFDQGLAEIGESKLSFTLLSSDTDESKDLSGYIQSQLEQNLGSSKINVSVQTVPFKTRLSRATDGNFDVVMSNWIADYSDPITFLALFTSENTYNDGNWKNPEYDKLIDASQNGDAGNKTKRWNDMIKASKILSEDQGIAPIYQSNDPVMISPKVKGLIHNSTGGYNFKETHLSE